MPTTQRTNRRGRRHLRVGLEIGPRSTSVTSMWLVDQPVVQAERLPDPVLARVDLAGSPALVQSFADPRVTRGAYRDDRGHAFARVDTGTVHVSVPFSEVADLGRVRIRVTDATGLEARPTDPGGVAALFEDPPAAMRTVRDVDAAALRAHPDWRRVAAALGIDVETGRFEVYADRAGRYRWRLRRPDGEIVADSGQGYDDRAACEADLRWLRANAATATIVPLDLA